jgi:hypothetical protein
MKRLILAAAFMLGVSCMANSQVVDKKSPEKRAAHITKALTKKLDLSQEQASKVNTVFLAQAARMDSLRSNKSADEKANHLAAHSIKLDTQKQVAAILNDDQKVKFAAWEKMHRRHHKERSAPKAAVEG